MSINVDSKETNDIRGGNTILIVLILILFVSFGLYFFLSLIYLPEKGNEEKLLGAEVSSLTQLITEENKNDLTSSQKKINDFKILFDNSLKVSNFFKSFESWAHSEIVYSSLKFDSSTRKVSVSGKTKSNKNLMQQISVWSSNETIESYDLSNIVIAVNGETSFDVNLIIKESVFK